MHRLHCRRMMLPEIADVERAVSGKIYPAGTVYVQVSACRRKGLEQFHMLEADSPIEGKYAVVVPKVDAYPPYLRTALNEYADRFMYRYVGTNINISIHDFKYFELGWHDSLEEQRRVMAILDPMEQEIKQEEEAIKAVKDFKTQMLNDMMVVAADKQRKVEICCESAADKEDGACGHFLN